MERDVCTVERGNHCGQALSTRACTSVSFLVETLFKVSIMGLRNCVRVFVSELPLVLAAFLCFRDGEPHFFKHSFLGVVVREC